jgi:hypothetical protein
MKYLWVPFLVPATVLFVVVFGRFLPQWFHPGFAIALAFIALIVITVRTRNRTHAEAGLKPKKSGYSAKLDLLTEKLRARADEIEAAQRFSRDLDFLPNALTEFVEEIRKTAKDVHHRDFAPNLPSLLQQDSNILDALAEMEEGSASPEPDPTIEPEIIRYISDLRKSASETEAYANEVRSQGGVYKLQGGQLAGCGILLLVCLGYGAYLIWQYYTSPRWELWAGLGMIAAALCFIYVLYRMQTEPA